MEKIFSEIEIIAIEHPELEFIFPIHPNPNIQKLKPILKHVNIINPLGYAKIIELLSNVKFVISDSGGIQEETTALGIPCLTLRENTERPITIIEGTNVLVGSSPDQIIKNYNHIMKNGGKKGKTPKLWDGKTAQRMVDIIEPIVNNIN